MARRGWKFWRRRGDANAKTQREAQGIKSEALEPRVLFSADLPWVEQSASESDHFEQSYEQALAPASTTSSANTEQQLAVRQNFVAVDPSLLEEQPFSVTDLRAHFESAGINVALLDRNDSGIDQLRELLSESSTLGSLQLLTTARAEGLVLGDSTLGVNDILTSANAVSGWFTQLDAASELRVYASNLQSYADADQLRELMATMAGSAFELQVFDNLQAVSAVQPQQEVRREIVFVDRGVDDYEALLADIRNASDDARQLEVVLLDTNRNGMEQISETLERYADLDAIHIVSHGADGSVLLGDSVLSLSNVSGYAEELAVWREALSDEADLLFYGCDLAASESGESLLETIADLTGADVAASDDLTGSLRLGGDWELEFLEGEIETQLAFSQSLQADWDQILASAVVYVTNTSDTVSGDTSSISALIADDGGDGISLREAILASNNSANGTGPDEIRFNIPGTGPHVINVTSALPTITEATIIDGTDQAGWVEGANLPIVLDGSGGTYDGLHFGAGADGSVVRGLVIRDFSGNGITIDAGTSGVSVAGNWIGRFDSDGTLLSGEGNDQAGVRVLGDNNLIGGTTAADRNVILDSNYAGGVLLTGAASTNNTISGNYFGTNIDGNSAATSSFVGYGVFAFNGASGNTVGGSTAAHGNVFGGLWEGISINGPGADNYIIQNNSIGVGADGTSLMWIEVYGIRIEDGDNAVIGGSGAGNEIVSSVNHADGIYLNNTDGTVVQGNYIGTNSAGTLDANLGDGIDVNSSVTNLLIGGIAAGEGNVITNANFAGVEVDGFGTTTHGVTIRGNSIYDNGTLGIDLEGNDQIEANDAGDGDTGSNNLQNSPVLLAAAINDAGTLSFAIDTSSFATGSYTIDFYASSERYGGVVQGERFLGTAGFVPWGNTSYFGSLGAVTLAPGEYVTALVTDGNGNTSEFSNYAVATDSDANGAAPSALNAVATTSGGLSLNEGGGNHSYLLADNGNALLGNLATLSYEIRYATTDTSTQSLISYATSSNDNEFKLVTQNDGDLLVQIGANSLRISDFDFRTLADGEAHTVSFTWQNSDGSWALYVDGAEQATGTGYAVGHTIDTAGALAIGNEQDGVNVGYDPNAALSATIFDARLFSDVRTAEEIASGYRNQLPHNESGMLANWQFAGLSADGLLVDAVAGNNLSLRQASGAGFIAGEPTLTWAVSENALSGTEVGRVAGFDAEREALIASLLAVDPTLVYSAETEKFYQLVSATSNWSSAHANAAATALNGVNGQLATIRSAVEQELVAGLAADAGQNIWLGASDSTAEGAWRWQTSSGDADQFWLGDQNGFSTNGAYTNWLSGKPDSGAGNEDALALRSSDGRWDDYLASNNFAHVVEWDADAVLDASQPLTYAIDGQTVSGAFAIDASTGLITVASSAALDYEANPSHSLDVTVTDGQGNSHIETLTIAINNQLETTQVVPLAQYGFEDTPLEFSVANGNALTVSDTLAGNDALLQVSLSVNDGALVLSQTTGVTFVERHHGTDSFVIRGTESAINAALEGMIFHPDADFNGTATLSIATALAADLAGHYTFESGAAATDQSAGSTYSGTLNGNAAIVNDAQRGDVLSLDGAGDFVQVPGLFGEPTDITLAAWVDLRGLDASGAAVISLGGAPALYYDSDGHLTGYYHTGSRAYVAEFSDSLVGDGWNHVAMTIDSAAQELTLFLNGEAVETLAAADPIAYFMGPDTHIGRHGDGSSGFDLDGQIDDARVYARALSSEEIAALVSDQTSVTSSVAITIDAVNDAPTFEAQGQSIFSAGETGYGQNDAMLVLADGSMIITPYDSNGDSVLVKLNADGSIDPSFGASGFADNTAIGAIQSIAQDSAGNILVGGFLNSNGFLARYDAAGNLDTGFGTGGVATIASTDFDAVAAIAVQPDGRIVTVGSDGNDSMVVRLLSNGTLDSSFDTDGIATLNLGGAFEHFNSVAIDGNGNVVAAGQSSVVRFTNTGALDLTFDSDGLLAVGHGVSAMILQDDGYIVAVGASAGDMVASRFDAGGALDSDFGTGGTATWSHGTEDVTASDIVQQADGSLVVAGHTTDYPTDFFAIRLSAEGVLDNSFGTNGAWLMDGSSDFSEVSTVALYHDGATERIVIGGYSTNLTDSARTTVVRLNSNGETDRTLGTNTLDASPVYVEDGAAVVLDADVQVFDAELSVSDNFSGAAVDIRRTGAANAEDLFGHTGLLGPLSTGADLIYNGAVVGLVNTNENGVLNLTFNTSATNDIVNGVMRSIAYSNSSDTPPASVDLNFSFNDGNYGPQGTGLAAYASEVVTVAITDVADPAQLQVPIAQSVDEDTPLVFSAAEGNAILIDSGSPFDPVVSVSLTVSNGALTLATTASISFLDGTSDGSANVTIAGTEDALNAALNGLAYLGDTDYHGADSLTVTTGSTAGTETSAYARYEFFDGSKADTSGNGYNGTRSGNPTLVNDPERGDVLAFDGDDLVSIANGTSGLGEEVTISAWVNLDAGQTNGTFLSIGDTFFVRLDPTNTSYGLGVSADGFTTYAFNPSENRIGGTGWHHVAATLNDTTNEVSVFLDGELIKSSTWAGIDIDWATAPSQNITIGGFSDGSNAFVGSVDDVRVYDTVLSSAEIAAVMGDHGYSAETVAITVDPVNDASVFTALPATSQATVDESLAGASVVATGDIDGDGALDVIGATNTGEVLWYRGDGNGGYGTGVSLLNTSGLDITAIATGDLDGDGDLDLVLTNNTPDNSEAGIYILDNQLQESGTSTFTLTTMETTSFGAYEVAIADVDGDSRLDIVASFNTTGEVILYQQDVLDTFTRSVAGTLSGARGIEIADIDGDTDLDIIAAGSSAVQWFENDGTANPGFTSRVAAAVSDVTDIVVANFDVDGDLDIGYVSGLFSTRLGWLESDGSATPSFTNQLIGSLTNFSQFGNLIAADMDGSGSSDLLVTNISQAELLIYDNDGSGTFTRDTQSFSLNGPEWVEAADLDGDGDLDLLLAQSGDGSIGAQFNRGGGLFSSVYANEDSTLAGLLVQIDDVDADGSDLSVTLTVGDGVVTLPTGSVVFAGGVSSSSTVTFTGTVAQINSTLNSFDFTPNADFFGDTVIHLSVNDLGNSGSGGAQIASESLLVHVQAENDVPVLNINTSDLWFTEQSPVGADVNATITDVDSGTLTGAVIRISANYEVGVDQLRFTDQNGIAGTYNNSTGVLTLRGTASVADYQTALRSIVFDNQSDTPASGTRTLEWTVSDGLLTSAPASRAVTITSVNDAPTTPNASASGPEDAVLTFVLSGSDIDGTVASFEISTLPANGTLYLDAALTNPIIALNTYAATSEQLTVYFSPDADWNGSTTFNFSAVDNQASWDATPATATLTIAPVNDVPVAVNDPRSPDQILTEDPATVGYWRLGESSGTTAVDETGVQDGTYSDVTLGAAGPYGSDTAVGFNGVNSHLNLGAIDVDGSGLTLTGWFYVDSFGSPAEGRIISKADGLAASSHTWMLSIDGTTSEERLRMRVSVGGTTSTLIASSGDLEAGRWYHAAATYDEASQQMRLYLDGEEVGSKTHSNSGDIDQDPSQDVWIGDNPGGGRALDGRIDEVAILDRALTQPEIQALASKSGSPYSVNEDATLEVNAAAGVLANDTDVEGDTLTVSLVSGPSNASSFSLAADGSFSYTGAANFNGTDSFVYQIDDGNGGTDTATVEITVLAVADAAALDLDADRSSGAGAPDFSASFTEGLGPVAVVDSDATLLDVDSVNLTGLTATLASRPDGTAELLSADTTGTSIVAFYNSATGVLTLSGSDTVAHYQQVLRTITYDNASEAPDLTQRSIVFAANDGLVESNTATTLVSVTAVNDVPALINNALTISEGGAVVLGAAELSAQDPDNPAATLTFIASSIVGGQFEAVANAGVAITSFTQQQVIDGDIQFVHDSGETVPSYAISVSDGAVASTPGAASISFTNVNDAPTGTVTIDNLAPAQGDTLTVSNTLADADGLSGPISYQWYRDGVAITGATSNTYATSQVDVGGAITVVASYTDDQGTTEGVVSAATSAVSNVNDAVSGQPVIVGTPTEDQTLTLDTSGISDADGLGSFSYQWYRDGVAVAGAAADSYLLGDADVDSLISVVVSYTDGYGAAESTTSNATAAIANVNDAVAGQPLILGTPTEDETLTVDTTGMSDADGLGSFSYQWYRDGVAVSGATNASYVLEDADVDRVLTVAVSYVDGRGTSESTTSVATGAIANVNDAPVGGVAISNLNPAQGDTLTASNTLLDDDGLSGPISYQWFRDGVAITGATLANYTTTQADVDSALSVVASYTDDQGTLESVASSDTAAVANVNDTVAGQPIIIGTATEDQTLMVDTSGISDPDGVGILNYQWYRDGAAITGATSSNFLLSDADVGANITVAVTYTDAYGASENTLSAAVGPVANVNDLPVIDAGLSFAVSENAAAGALIGTVTAADIDLATTLSDWAIVSGDPAGLFEIDRDSGEIRVAANAVIDYEAAASHVLGVQVSDGVGVSAVASVTINITDINEAPLAVDDALATAEDTAITIRTADLLGNDSDPEAMPLSLLAIGQPANGVLIDQLDGTWLYQPNSNFNGTERISYMVTDGLSQRVAELQLTVSAVNDAPEVTTPNLIAMQEDLTNVATIAVLDADGDLPSFSLSGGVDAAAFEVNEATGALRFAGAPDFENPIDQNQDNVYELVVAVSDGSGSVVEHPLQIVVADINEAPSLQSARFVAEQSDTGMLLGTLSANDPDTGDTLSYQIVGGDDGQLFQVDQATGELYRSAQGTPIGIYRLDVQVVDASGEASAAVVEIIINETPAQQTPLLDTGLAPDQDNVDRNSNDDTPSSQPPIDQNPDTVEVQDSADDSESGERSAAAFAAPALSELGNVPLTADIDSAGIGLSLGQFLVASNDAAESSKPSVDRLANLHTSMRFVFAQAGASDAFESAGALLDQFAALTLPVSSELVRALDTLAEEALAGDRDIELRASGVLVGTISLSAGFVVWMLRGGALMASLLSTKPMWSEFDPLPVFSDDENESDRGHAF